MPLINFDEIGPTIIAFFNNKGGVGKTSLVYHLSWMFEQLQCRVVAADLDPQANLTAAFFDEDKMEKIWDETDKPHTVYGCVQPIIKGTGDIQEPILEPISDHLALLVGDLSLSGFEDELSNQWPDCLDGKERAFRVISAFWRILQRAGENFAADAILIDLGPNLGALNRAALISADYVVIPLSPDLFSLQGLKNLGPTFRRWRIEWKERLKKNPDPKLKLPEGKMTPAGYIILQHSVRLDRPARAYERWIAKMPKTYRQYVLDEKGGERILVEKDKNCLALLKHYRSLMPMAQEARKPIFALNPADGAIGSHLGSVENAKNDFMQLAREIATRTGVDLPS